MRITQCSVDRQISFFKENFFERYQFSELNNKKDPCVFFGIINQVELINNHNGIKILLLKDKNDIDELKKINNSENTFIINHAKFNICENRFKIIDEVIEIKNYDMFKPKKLGNKIYAYIGLKWRRQHFKYDLIKKIENDINYEIIIPEYNDVSEYKDIFYVKENYYDNCFLNLNFSNGSSLTTLIELSLMGVKTISNMEVNYPSLIRYKNYDDIINIIKHESLKINKIQDSINIHTIKDEWLNTNFYI